MSYERAPDSLPPIPPIVRSAAAPSRRRWPIRRQAAGRRRGSELGALPLIAAAAGIASKAGAVASVARSVGSVFGGGRRAAATNRLTDNYNRARNGDADALGYLRAVADPKSNNPGHAKATAARYLAQLGPGAGAGELARPVVASAREAVSRVQSVSGWVNKAQSVAERARAGQTKVSEDARRLADTTRRYADMAEELIARGDIPGGTRASAAAQRFANAARAASDTANSVADTGDRAGAAVVAGTRAASGAAVTGNENTGALLALATGPMGKIALAGGIAAFVLPKILGGIRR